MPTAQPKIEIPTTAEAHGHVVVGSLRLADAPEGASFDASTALAKVRAGEQVSLKMDILAYLQNDTPNRNYVRFREQSLRAFARSFRGMPFLRDHEQQDVRARAGTIVDSKLEDMPDGTRAIRQTVELRAPWAVELAANQLMDRFSIGWRRTGPIVCSVCEEAYLDGLFGSYPACEHWPGDEVADDQGNKATAQAVFTKADGIETSAVTVPAVLGTGVESIQALRAELSERKTKETRMHAKLCALLGLAMTVSEDDVLAAVTTLKSDRDAARAEAEVEQKAHAATRESLAGFEAERKAAEAADRARRVEGLKAKVREKVGGSDKEPSPVEAAALQLGELDLAKAESWVEKLAPVLPIGRRLQSGGPAPEAPPSVTGLTDEVRRTNQILGITDEDWKKYNPFRSEAGR